MSQDVARPNLVEMADTVSEVRVIARIQAGHQGTGRH